MDKNLKPILVKSQTYCILTLAAICIIISTIILLKSEPVYVKELSQITVTPLDSPDPCYPQYFWRKVE